MKRKQKENESSLVIDRLRENEKRARNLKLEQKQVQLRGIKIMNVIDNLS